RESRLRTTNEDRRDAPSGRASARELPRRPATACRSTTDADQGPPPPRSRPPSCGGRGGRRYATRRRSRRASGVVRSWHPPLGRYAVEPKTASRTPPHIECIDRAVRRPVESTPKSAVSTDRVGPIVM